MPLIVQTIHRHELLSTFLLSKLMVSVHNSLQHQITHLNMRCYTDSQVALYWIRDKDKEWKPFIQNRVNEIRRNVHPNLWYHCTGSTNPANLSSRGLTTMLELSVGHLWCNGLDWLTLGVALHSDHESNIMPELCTQELKSASKSCHNLLIVERNLAIGDLMHC